MPNMPSISPLGTNATPQTRGAEQSAIKRNSGIDMDDFLKILAATMSNPSMGGESGGGSNNDHISQLVQFTTLEQLETLGTNLENTMMMTQQQQAMSMIDKEVTLVNEKGEEITGKVERVKFLGGTPTIIVEGKEYSMGNIAELGK
ncbi:flagellar hook capping FlgD N-terminal domain-containing protein [Vagococcus sp.]|uniref:flagellar hook capping FlgD N-terminal domain-containing protein n=1 Tax=Vagococcus sp. TaxID=1933889 RepID=UPI003F9DBB80